MKGFPIPAWITRRGPLKTNPSHFGLDFKDVSFCTRKCQDIILLRGWYIPSENSNRCIIAVHGWGANRAHREVEMLKLAKELVSKGYNILTFDLRAHGESEGNKVSFGYYETYDVLGAYDFVVKKKNIPPQNVGLIGFSYGAMISILAAASERISGVIADSGPGDTFGFIEEITLVKVKWCPPLFYAAKGLTKVLMLMMGKLFGIDVSALNTKEAVKKISTPIFFIYGAKDNIPLSLVQTLHQSKKRNPLDRIWITDARHVKSYKTHPEEYLKNIIDFFNETLKPA